MANLNGGVPGENPPPSCYTVRVAHKNANLDGGVPEEDTEHHVIRVAHKWQTLMVAYLERTQSIML
jgi:hypothetical protein